MSRDSGSTEITGNIGPKEIRKRRILGFAALSAGALLAFALFALNAPRPLRLFVFFPIWLAGLGLFQAREKTCIALAARGVCNMDSGETEIMDKRTRKALREKARQINRRALMTAAIVTLVALAFPAGRI
jgi:hypothetical protein